MGNIMPRVGLKPTSLTFRATPYSPAAATTIPMPTSLCSTLPQWSVQTTTLVLPGIVSLLLLIITYIQAMAVTYT